MKNIDRLVAKRAQKIIQRIVIEEETQKDKPQDKKKTKQKLAAEVENSITKALGVLQENGVYACFLYLLAKEGEYGKVIVDEMTKLLQALEIGYRPPETLETEQVLASIAGENENALSNNLEKLLLAKESLEQMLIYARYGAKAKEKEEKDKEGSES